MIDALGDEGQRLLVSLLVTDREAADLYLSDLDPAYVDGPAARWLVATARTFHARHALPPPPEAIDAALAAALGSGEVDPGLAAEVRALYLQIVTRATSSPSYPALRAALLEAAPEWLRQRALVATVQRVAERLARGEAIDDAASAFARALAVGAGDGGPLRYAAADADAYFAALDAARTVPRVGFGLDALDRAIGGGIGPGMLGAILAGTGRGKSHLLQYLGLVTLARGGRVLHVSLEMSETEVFLRFAAGVTGIDSALIRDDPAIARDLYRERIAAWDGDIRIVVRPARSLTVAQLGGLIDRITAVEAFTPDLVVVDYADLLLAGGLGGHRDKEYVEQRVVYEELRGLAQRLRVPIWTAMQTNRQGHERDHGLSLGDVGNSYDKTRVCDLILSWETGDEKRVGALQYGTLRPLKVRGAAPGTPVEVVIDLRTSALALASLTPPTADLMQQVVAGANGATQP